MIPNCDCTDNPCVDGCRKLWSEWYKQTESRTYKTIAEYETWEGGIQFSIFGKWFRFGAKKVIHRMPATFTGASIDWGFVKRSENQ